MSTSQSNSGLFSSMKNLVALLLTSGKTRLELLGNEINEEKLRIVHLFLLAQGVVLCFGVCAFFIVAFFAVLFWDNRVLVFGVFALIFFFSGLVFLFSFRRAAHRPRHMFEDSLAMLEEDVRQLKAATSHDKQKTE